MARLIMDKPQIVLDVVKLGQASAPERLGVPLSDVCGRTKYPSVISRNQEQRTGKPLVIRGRSHLELATSIV